MADRREQLLAAFDEVESDEEETGAGNESSVPDHENESAATDDKPVLGSGDENATGADSGTKNDAGKEPSADDAGRVGKAGNKAARPDPRKPAVDSSAKNVPPKADTSKGAKDDAAKASEAAERAAAVGEGPKSWKPEIREHWAKLPKEVRDQVNQREQEITQFIGRHGAAIQHKAQFDEIVQPFMPFIAAQQSTPMKAFHGLMTTAARLTTGAPQQKAAVISEIMDNYGVDAKTLDEYLFAKQSGKLPGLPPGMAPPNNGPPEWAKPLFNFMQTAEQARQSREERVQQEAAAELAKFEAKPFYADLREDMGLLMSRAAKKGELLTMDQAYEKARRMNPEIDKILTQRERAATGNGANGGGSNIDRARRAASSIKGAPSGAASAAAGAKKNEPAKDRRATLAAAFDAHSED